MEVCAPMETDAVDGDHMETEEEGSGRPENADWDGHWGESHSGSDMACLSRSQFWYEVRGLRNIPDYRVLAYPWEEEKEEEEEEQGCSYFLEVTERSYSDSAEELRKRQRLDVQPGTAGSDSTIHAVSPSLPTPERVPGDSSQCTSAEVLAVRLEMHECLEDGVSCRRLFFCDANKEELRCSDNVHKEPYMLYISRRQHESAVPLSYAHVFPKLSGGNPDICSEWVRPTTLEGDRRYLKFFRMLEKNTKYGQTKDQVMAKGILLADKSFRKMLYFQIDIAVKDIMELMENEERMQQRYNLYYFAASEMVLNEKDFEAVLKSIRDGDSGLPYDLTEFGSCNSDFWDGVIADMLSCLVSHLRAERKQGRYNEWLFDRVDINVAQIVCEMVNEQLGFQRHFYVDFLRQKMKIAKDHGLLLPRDTDSEQL